MAKQQEVKQWNRGELKTYGAGNSQLLLDYRIALIEAYKLGEDIKDLYGVIPPKAIFDTFATTTEVEHRVHIGLVIN